MTRRTIVIVESPFSHPTRTRDECVRYAQFAVLDCLERGECPFASHLFLTAILPEDKRSREIGLECRDRIACATGGVVARYVDIGTTPGMYRAVDCTAAVEERRLPDAMLARWKRGEHLVGSLALGVSTDWLGVHAALDLRDAYAAEASAARETIAALRAEIETLRGLRT